jgi:cell division protein FtsZ
MMEKSVLEEQIVSMLTKGLVKPKITVVGCGGAGNNIVHSIHWNGDSDVETIAVNTDETKLGKIEADKKILIGKDITRGRGAGGFPEIGEYCAECAREVLETHMGDNDIVFIIAGMGGGTGTGSAPIVAEIARERGAITFAIAINPFSHEVDRSEKAIEGVERLKQAAETTIVLENDRLLEIAGNLALKETFSIMERSIMKIINSVDNRISESFYLQIETDVKDMLDEMNEAELEDLSDLTSRRPNPPVPVPQSEMVMEVPEMSPGLDPGMNLL